MKKHIIPVSFTVLILLAFASCKKDLGNYNYTDVNTISITTDMTTADPQVVITNDSVVVKQNDSLKLDILLSQTQQSEELSYQWMITQTSASASNPGQYIVGNEKQLRTKITLPPNVYRLVLKVTDNKTGVSYYKFYSLNVDTAPSGGEGWLVLQAQTAQGGCDVSIITSRDGVNRGVVFNNLYAGANDHKLPAGTYKMAVMNYNNTLRIQKLAFYYPNGGTQVRSVDYLDSSNHTGWFLIQPSVVNVQSNGVAPINSQYEYMINDGQLYYQAVNATSIKSPIRFGAPVIGSWPALSPYVMNSPGSDYYLTLFDKVNHCFFLFNASTGAFVPALADVPNKHFANYSGPAAELLTNGKGFDLNNIRHDLIYAENAQNSTGVPTTYDCIFRNTIGDSTFLYQISTGLSYTNNIATGRYYLKESQVPGINTASLFAVPTFLTLPGGAFYYVPGTEKNSIYVCNPTYTTTPSTPMPATTKSHVGYSFQAGTIIKAMKVFKSGYTAAPTTDSKVLVVATDETAIGKGNNVYFFSLKNDGEIDNTPSSIKVYTGFDKIVDIAYKKALGQ